MGKVVAIVNQKGGVGKTTTVINLAASMALGGKDILVIDTDPQGNLTSGLGVSRDDLPSSLYDVFSGRCSLGETARATGVDHLILVPSSLDLLGVELELISRERREHVLADAVAGVRDRYQYVLIDCPPSLGLLTLNGLVAADSVIVPVQCEYYSLEGLGLLSRTLALVRSSLNPGLDIQGIVLTMFDTRNTLSHQVAAEVRKFFNEKVYQTAIPRNVTLGEAPSHGKPAILYDARSRGAQSYLSLAMEVLDEARLG